MILDVLAAASRKRVKAAKDKIPMKDMERLAFETLERTKERELSFERSLSSPGISFICEIKRASPSKGIIAREFPYVEIAKDYATAGGCHIRPHRTGILSGKQQLPDRNQP